MRHKDQRRFASFSHAVAENVACILYGFILVLTFQQLTQVHARSFEAIIRASPSGSNLEYSPDSNDNSDLGTEDSSNESEQPSQSPLISVQFMPSLIQQSISENTTAILNVPIAKIRANITFNDIRTLDIYNLIQNRSQLLQQNIRKPPTNSYEDFFQFDCHLLNHQNIFAIGKQNCEITLTQGLSNNTYIIDTKVLITPKHLYQQQIGAFKFETRVPIMIDVLDINNNEPESVDNFLSCITYDNIDVNTPICTAPFKDDDRGPNAELTYSMLSADENDSKLSNLRIDSKTGSIYRRFSNIPLNQSDVSAIISAKDNGVPYLETSVRAKISIIESNRTIKRGFNEKPYIPDQHTKLKIILTGTEEPGASISNLTPYDADGDVPAMHIVGGDPNATFAVNDGSLMVAKNIDFSEKRMVNLTIFLTDGAEKSYFNVTILVPKLIRWIPNKFFNSSATITAITKQHSTLIDLSRYALDKAHANYKFYSASSNEIYNSFEVDQYTGGVTFSRDVNHGFNGEHRVMLSIEDNRLSRDYFRTFVEVIITIDIDPPPKPTSTTTTTTSTTTTTTTTTTSTTTTTTTTTPRPTVIPTSTSTSTLRLTTMMATSTTTIQPYVVQTTQKTIFHSPSTSNTTPFVRPFTFPPMFSTQAPPHEKTFTQQTLLNDPWNSFLNSHSSKIPVAPPPPPPPPPLLVPQHPVAPAPPPTITVADSQISVTTLSRIVIGIMAILFMLTCSCLICRCCCRTPRSKRYRDKNGTLLNRSSFNSQHRLQTNHHHGQSSHVTASMSRNVNSRLSLRASGATPAHVRGGPHSKFAGDSVSLSAMNERSNKQKPLLMPPSPAGTHNSVLTHEGDEDLYANAFGPGHPQYLNELRRLKPDYSRLSARMQSSRKTTNSTNLGDVRPTNDRYQSKSSSALPKTPARTSSQSNQIKNKSAVNQRPLPVRTSIHNRSSDLNGSRTTNTSTNVSPSLNDNNSRTVLLRSDDIPSPRRNNRCRQRNASKRLHTDSAAEYDDVASRSTVDDTTPQTSSENASMSEMPFEARFKTFVKQKKNKPSDTATGAPETALISEHYDRQLPPAPSGGDTDNENTVNLLSEHYADALPIGLERANQVNSNSTNNGIGSMSRLTQSVAFSSDGRPNISTDVRPEANERGDAAKNSTSGSSSSSASRSSSSAETSNRDNERPEEINGKQKQRTNELNDDSSEEESAEEPEEGVYDLGTSKLFLD